MTAEFQKPVKVVPAIVGQIADPDAYNSNIAAQSKGTMIPIDEDGNYADGEIGDQTVGSVGALITNLKLRQGAFIKIYDAFGVFVKNVNFEQATESLEGVAELATQTETNTGTDDLRIVTPLKLKTRQGYRYVGRLTASNSSSLSQAFSTGKKYEFHFFNILPATNNSWLTAQFSSDNGSSWINSGYLQRKLWATTSDAANSSTDKTSGLTIAGRDADGNTGINNTASKGGLSGILEIYDPSNSSIYTQAYWHNVYRLNSSFDYNGQIEGSAHYNATTAITNIQFIMKAVNSDTNSGNITSGYIDVWEFNA